MHRGLRVVTVPDPDEPHRRLRLTGYNGCRRGDKKVYPFPPLDKAHADNYQIVPCFVRSQTASDHALCVGLVEIASWHARTRDLRRPLRQYMSLSQPEKGIIAL